MTVRDGNAEWRGDVGSGSGEITVGDGVFKGRTPSPRDSKAAREPIPSS